MTARTHDLAAITALGLTVFMEPTRTMTLSTAIAAIIANQIGGIVPDIDQPTAPLWRNLPIGRVFGRFAGRLVGGHRFLTHSLLGVTAFAFLTRSLLALLHPIMPHVDVGLVCWAFLIGMLSHLVMDTFTKEGVPWLLPIPVKVGLPPLRRWRITTGKAVETLFVFPGLLAIDIWLFASHYNELIILVHRHLVY